MTENELLGQLRLNPFVLAPMAGITDHAFRSFMKRHKAGIVVSELVSSDGIEYGSERTLRLLNFDESQRPVGLQLFGDDPAVLGRAARVCEDKGADFVDLNFGCPVPKVVKKGAGSAVLKDMDQLKRILAGVKAAVKIPVTIKIRTGWEQNSRNADEVCRIAFNEGITWVAIHGRTRAQGYSGLADWEYIQRVKASSPLPVLGNGDIHTANAAVARLQTSGCDGVLIGRGCLKNPNIFAQALAIYSQVEAPIKTIDSMFDDLHEHLRAHCDDHLVGLQLKKFASWYSAGYPGASSFRKAIFQTKETSAVLSTAKEFFAAMPVAQQLDTSQEAFLMGGHG